MKRLFRFAGLVALAAAIVWLTREHLLPTPHVSHEPPPHYRSTPPPAAAPDDLTVIKGIGPVYAARLADIGIVTFHTLADADTQTVAHATGAAPSVITEWVEQAKGRTT
jgi:predicted flap endonuclease-1-like 5' DNA nuclease